MDMLAPVLIMLLVIAVVIGITYYIPFPPPLAWLKWAVPTILLIICLIWLFQHFR